MFTRWLQKSPRNDKGGEHVKRRYWKLEGLMSKYGLFQSDMAKIAEMSLPSISKKFYKNQDFKVSNAANIAEYFREKGEDFNFEEYFVIPVVAKVTAE